jgi:cell division protein FtsW
MDKKNVDFGVLATVIILLCAGLLMLFSASSPSSYSSHSDLYYIFKKQLLFAVIGIILMIGTINLDYHFLKRLTVPVVVVSIVLLAMTQIKGLSYTANNATRWIKVGSYTFQPSEFGKFAVILILASGMSLKIKRTQKPPLFKEVLPYFLVIGIYIGLLVKQPHYSAAIIIITITVIILFISGIKIRYFISLILASILGMIVVMSTVDYVKIRVYTTLDPFEYPLDEGYQIVQSLLAIGSGGLMGRGFGRSMQKFLYIPEPHNDFIFPIYAEELGFIGVIGLFTLLLILVWKGINIARNAKDSFGTLLAAGITSLIFIQSVFNIGVAVSVIPNTGISLPFFSNGGTALMTFMAEMGILLNISKQSDYKKL